MNQFPRVLIYTRFEYTITRKYLLFYILYFILFLFNEFLLPLIEIIDFSLSKNLMLVKLMLAIILFFFNGCLEIWAVRPGAAIDIVGYHLAIAHLALICYLIIILTIKYNW